MCFKRWLKFLHYKWVKGKCRHFCSLCTYREQCFYDLDV